MRSKHCLRWIAVMAAVLAGCAMARKYPPPPLPSSEQLVEIGSQPPQAGAAPSIFDNRGRASAPRNVLVLSGGGMYGAYTAGVLKGWTESGARPHFDVVTGVSTGALVAPYAFLGPDYDAELAQLYTSMRRESVFRPRLPFFDSIGSSEPLQQQIAARATPEILRRIAEAHRQGRRLYVGTTNLDTKRLVVWDMGAIAARDSAESRMLFQKVLLASCSIPGLLPPVPIDVEIDGKRFTELHVDGSIAACVFLQPAMIGIGPRGALPPDTVPSSIRIIVAGKLHQTASPTKGGLFSIAGESVSTVLQAKTEGELTQLFLLARYAGADFRLAGIPQDYAVSGDCMSFDPQVMRGLFDVGYRGGREGTAWHLFPPGLEQARTSAARGDTRFVTVPASSSPELMDAAENPHHVGVKKRGEETLPGRIRSVRMPPCLAPCDQSPMVCQRDCRRSCSAAIVALALVRPAAADTVATTTPYRGVTEIVETLTLSASQTANIHLIEVNLRAPGIGARLSPASPPSANTYGDETSVETTLGYLNRVHAQVAVNAQFFHPCPAEPNGGTNLVGFAASEGKVYAPFDDAPAQSYAIVANAPGLNIGTDNAAQIVLRGPTAGSLVSASNTAVSVTPYNTVTGSANHYRRRHNDSHLQLQRPALQRHDQLHQQQLLVQRRHGADGRRAERGWPDAVSVHRGRRRGQ